MRIHRVLAAALLAVPLAAAPVAAHAAPDPDLHIDAVTMNKTAVTEQLFS